MRRLLKAMGCVAILSVMEPAARAEPGPTTKWLMDRPFTLWDIGMMRLEEAVEEATSKSSIKGKHSLTKVRYVWEHDQIYISFAGHSPDGVVTHESCNQVRRV